MTQTIRIGVMRGGPSEEYGVSLKTGSNVLAVLRNNYADKYEPHDVLIDRSGNWYFDGVAISAGRACERIDCIFNAMHGSFGEDGKVQHILEMHGVPFTGSGSFSSAAAMNKITAKKIMADSGVKTPRHIEIKSEEITADPERSASSLFRTLLLPAIVKPVSSGSSVGVSIVRAYGDLPRSLAVAAAPGGGVMIEEYIPGVEATCGVMEHFRGEALYALPAIEIRPETSFFDYEAKYAGRSREIVPSTFTDQIKNTIHELAKEIHRALGLRHYSRSDFIIHPKKGIYALEVNTLPGLTEESLFPKALEAVGSGTGELVDHIIGLALRTRYNAV
ncbi:D-alanine--D-alanine ligase [Patescibacteria group bacterium]|nr:D-alanine--D-alanine ligase [Patescibacteria group bacterium]